MEVPQEEEQQGSEPWIEDEQHDIEPGAVSIEEDVRPRRQPRLPSYLSDYDLTGAIQSRLLNPTRPPSPVDSDRAYRPSIPSSNPHSIFRDYDHEHEVRSHRPDLVSSLLLELEKAKWQYTEEHRQALIMERENKDLRRQFSRHPDTIRKLQELEMEREALQERVRQLERSKQSIPTTPKDVPTSRASYHSAEVRENPDPYFVADLEERLRRLEMQSHNEPFSNISRSVYAAPNSYYTRHYSPTHQADHRSPEVSSLRHQPPQHRSSYYRPEHVAPTGQERTYRGPTPTIPNFVHPDAREFSRLRTALENLLPADATERFKFQILTDHLKLEEALLIADSYCNSRYPFTDTMEALNKQYGQPHQLALQRIAELMDRSDISSGDVKAFRMFALNVRSLVSMLQQLGRKGQIELECGSHVTRLLGKLPQELRASFRRFIHPLQVPIPTLLDLSEWLEYEMQVHEDVVTVTTHAHRGIQRGGKEQHRGAKPTTKSANILISTEKPASSGLQEQSLPIVDSKSKEKRREYCPYCDNNDHYLNGCSNFKQLTRDQKEKWIRDKHRCWRCGRGHQAARCTLKAPCKTCNRRHLLVLHEVNDKVSDKIKESASETSPPDNSCFMNTMGETLYIDRPAASRKVLLKISKVLLKNGDRSLETYAVLDDGSERTILLHPAAKKLGLTGEPESLPLRTVNRELSVLHGASVAFTICPATQPYKAFKIHNAFTAEMLSLAEHTHPIVALQQKYHHLRDLPLQEITLAHPLLLIGSDYPHLITPIEPVRLGPPGGPAAIRTRLGWTLQGPAHEVKQRLSSTQCLFTSTPPLSCDLYSNVEKLWKLDVLPYRSTKVVTRSKQDEEAVKLLDSKTVRVEVNGVHRYATPMLRVKSMGLLHAPKEATLSLLRSIERRLDKDPERAAAYQAEITKLQESGYVVQLRPEEVEKTAEAWYVPHHMVQHNGKNRVVFNCSFQYGGNNLNKLLLPGPTLGPSLLAVLVRFREHRVAISSDIRGMFHQVLLLPEDRPLFRFLWRNLKKDAPPSVYEWRVLPFGTTCSPCCAIYALQRHVTNYSKPPDRVRECVEKSFYVDNCLHSLTSEEEAKELVERLRDLLATGGFDLRQWASNIPSTISHLPSDVISNSCEFGLTDTDPNQPECTLGLQWHCHTDTLHYNPRPAGVTVTTMRNIYRTLASQYDPLGYIIPYTTRAKVIVQHLWSNSREWDDPQLPTDLLQAWQAWESELPNLQNISLPRCYTSPGLDHPQSLRDIHVFCDASENAYGSVAYLRTEGPQGQVEVAFIAARSRVAPKKQQSIPRLELCAALTGAQLANMLNTELSIPICSTTLWSDSTTVLTWIKSESCRFKVFVGTRVAEIQELTDSASWRYVDSKSNPADDITRGKSLAELAQPSRWNKGPSFLQSSPDTWPPSPSVTTDVEVNELRKGAFCGLSVRGEDHNLPDAKQYYNYRDFIDAVAHSLHSAAGRTDALSAEDFQHAEVTILRQAQQDSFPSEVAHLSSGQSVPSTSHLLSLAPEWDSESGLIRVGGRLRRTDLLDMQTIHPVVLDSRHPITRLIIEDFDTQLQHPGSERVFSEVRRKYWIIKGRQAIRQYQHKCQGCHKWKGKPHIPKMADLPPARLRLFKPAFHSTGVDCFGPYLVKMGRRREKRWGIVFKCLTTRAIHLDLLSNMDTDSFLMALRRFIARRGKPSELYSDQGTNFKGGERELRETFADLRPQIQEQLASQQISFVFNPPAAPHFGGCWEREIRSLKSALQVTLGDQVVTDEVLRTLLIEIEGILNSKPLGYTSSDVADIDPVTPNMLLMGRLDSSLPQVVYPESEMLSRRRWRHSQLLADHFWKHFTRYYLPGLQVRQKWRTEADDLQVGTTVMVVDNQLPRAQWPVGLVTQVFPGADGRVRTAEVKVKDRTYTRPVARLVCIPALTD